MKDVKDFVLQQLKNYKHQNNVNDCLKELDNQIEAARLEFIKEDSKRYFSELIDKFQTEKTLREFLEELPHEDNPCSTSSTKKEI